jgi:hypothetical protein
MNRVLLRDAGLIESTSAAGDRKLIAVPNHLTWQGHEFLDNAKDDKRWARTMEAGRQVGGFGLDVLKDVLRNLAAGAAEGYVKGLRP